VHCDTPYCDTSYCDTIYYDASCCATTSCDTSFCDSLLSPLRQIAMAGPLRCSGLTCVTVSLSVLYCDSLSGEGVCVLLGEDVVKLAQSVYSPFAPDQFLAYW